LRVVTPTHLNREEKDLLKQFEKLRQKSSSDKSGKESGKRRMPRS